MPSVAERHQPAHSLEWVRPPRQARTRQSLDRMLDAAEHLVAARGFADAGVVEIARRAGSSVGGFYRRFRDKQGLLQALHERFCEEARATADAALDPARWSGASTAEIMRQFSAFLLQIYREREGAFRAFLLAAMTDETVRRRTLELRQYLHQRLAALLAARRAEIAHPDPEVGSAFALDMILATLSQAVQFQQGPLGLADPHLDSELPRACLAYLGVRGD